MQEGVGSQDQRFALVRLARVSAWQYIQSVRAGLTGRSSSAPWRYAKPHVTKERYIKAFDPAVAEAMQRMQVVLNSLQAWPADELRGM